MNRFYLDASVALHAVLQEGDPRAIAWLDALSSGTSHAFASTLLQLEIARTLRRERLDPELARLVVDRVGLISIDDAVLLVAGGLEPHVKALDAIHLATCLMLGADVTLVTHDMNIAAAAATLGIEAFDPLAGTRAR